MSFVNLWLINRRHSRLSQPWKLKWLSSKSGSDGADESGHVATTNVVTQQIRVTG